MICVKERTALRTFFREFDERCCHAQEPRMSVRAPVIDTIFFMGPSLSTWVVVKIMVPFWVPYILGAVL